MMDSFFNNYIYNILKVSPGQAHYYLQFFISNESRRPGFITNAGFQSGVSDNMVNQVPSARFICAEPMPASALTLLSLWPSLPEDQPFFCCRNPLPVCALQNPYIYYMSRNWVVPPFLVCYPVVWTFRTWIWRNVTFEKTGLPEFYILKAACLRIRNYLSQTAAKDLFAL